MGQGGAAEAHDAGLSGGALVAVRIILKHIEADGTEVAGMLAEHASCAEQGECTPVRDVVKDYRPDGPANLAIPGLHETGFGDNR